VKHVLSARQFSKKELAILFKRADDMRAAVRSPHKRRTLTELHKGRVMATLFYEPSTRTRLSFETAAQRLGMSLVSTENANDSSSNAKGETLEDSIRTVSSYADVIVLRHPQTGSADRAAAVSKVPIINAGDGGRGQHPTQALLDLYTIVKELGLPDAKVIALCGALKYYRPSRSLATLLALYSPTKIILVSPAALKMQIDIKRLLVNANINYIETEDFDRAISEADVLYQNRIPKEYFQTVKEYKKYKGRYVLTTQKANSMKNGSIIMHPLPRVDEIEPEVDSNSRTAYFRQAENGLYVRMALLDLLLSRSRY